MTTNDNILDNQPQNPEPKKSRKLEYFFLAAMGILLGVGVMSFIHSANTRHFDDDLVQNCIIVALPFFLTSLAAFLQKRSAGR